MSASERSLISRGKERGSYDRVAAYRILDEGLVCHVGFADGPQPFVIPMVYGRRDDTLLLHGSVASRLQRDLAEGIQACVEVTLLDGLVLARSTFHHSLNYRSVVAFGVAQALDEPASRLDALEHIVEHLVPGRSADARGPNPKELAATSVLEFQLSELSVKSRMGPPSDAEPDLNSSIWAGVVPLAQEPREPIADEHVPEGVAVPDYVAGYSRQQG